MFYREESLSKLLKCPTCQSRMTTAKILPCGIFCNSCEIELLKGTKPSAKEFKCNFCNESHPIPKNGFKIWKELTDFNLQKISIDDISRGEPAEKLKNGLKEIKKQIDELSFKLENGINLIREHCTKLRTEVTNQSDIAIKQVQDLKSNLINQINEHELESVDNFEKNGIANDMLNNLINELQFFHKEWTQYLNEIQIDDSEIEQANKFIIELKVRIDNEKNDFDKLIFNNKFMNFYKKEIKLEETFLGNFEYENDVDKRPENNFKGSQNSIDINICQTILLKVILPSFNDAASVPSFDAFNEGKFAVIYPNNSHKITLTIIDKNRVIYKSAELNVDYYSDSFNPYKLKLKSLKELFVFYYVNNFRDPCLATVDANLESTNSFQMSHFVTSLDANEKNIYCLTNYPDYKIIIYDHHLINLRNVGQSINPKQPFFFTKVIKMLNKNNNFYFLFTNKLEIINEEFGVLIKSIQVSGNEITFDNDGNLFILSIYASKIYKLNLNGVLQDEIELKNCTNEFEFYVDKNGQFGFYNRAEKVLNLI